MQIAVYGTPAVIVVHIVEEASDAARKYRSLRQLYSVSQLYV